MDGHRFDELTRALARGTSRRAAVTGVLAGAAAVVIGLPRGRRASAQQNVPIGGRCTTFGASAECSQAGTPAAGVAVICSDNGITRDGSYNCCRNSGGVCSADFHCCGGAFCVNGVCGGTSSTSGLRLGSSCTSTSECSQTGGSVVCADNGVAEDGAKNCCRNLGGSCGGDLDCCAGAFCINGICGGSGTSGSSSNLAPGAECTSSSQCSQAGGTTVCASNGYDTDGALNCCRNEGGACSDRVYSADCCGGYYCREGKCTQITTDGLNALGVRCTATDQCSQDGGAVTCADNGTPDDGALNCCRYGGGACERDGQCCAGLLCVNGACGGTSSAGASGLALGAACGAASECSQAGGEVACADNGIAADGALNCCRYAGGACSGGQGCCAGLECVGGVCGGSADAGGGGASGLVGLGGECSSDEQCSQEGGEVACRDNGLLGDGERNCCRYQGGACYGDSGCCAGYLCIDGICQG